MYLIRSDIPLGGRNMKKLVISYIFFTTLISALNFPIYIYECFEYYSEDSIKEDIEANYQFYKNGNTPDSFNKHCGNTLTELMNVLEASEYLPCTKNDTIRLLFFENGGDNSILVSMPMKYDHYSDADRLVYFYYFDKDEKSYIFCIYYTEETAKYKLYTCSLTDEAKALLQSDCFSKRQLIDRVEHIIPAAAKVTLKCFLPVIIVALILLLPIFTEGKRSTAEARKLAKIMAKIGFAVIPVLLFAVYVMLYL